MRETEDDQEETHGGWGRLSSLVSSPLSAFSRSLSWQIKPDSLPEIGTKVILRPQVKAEEK